MFHDALGERNAIHRHASIVPETGFRTIEAWSQGQDVRFQRIGTMGMAVAPIAAHPRRSNEKRHPVMEWRLPVVELPGIEPGSDDRTLSLLRA